MNNPHYFPLKTWDFLCKVKWEFFLCEYCSECLCKLNIEEGRLLPSSLESYRIRVVVIITLRGWLAWTCNRQQKLLGKKRRCKGDVYGRVTSILPQRASDDSGRVVFYGHPFFMCGRLSSIYIVDIRKSFMI